MKKVTILCAVMALLMISTALYAAEVSDMHFGVKGGVGLAKAWGDDVSDNAKFKLGANVGGFMSYCVHEMFVVQPEVFFAMKGLKLECEDAGGDDEIIKLNYVDIDVLAKLMIPMEGMIKPCIFAGPYLGINISADYECGDVEEEIDNIKSTDFGIVVGGGADFEMENGMTILLDIRYSLGLTNVFDLPEDAEEGTEEPDAKNNAIIFMAGIAF